MNVLEWYNRFYENSHDYSGGKTVRDRKIEDALVLGTVLFLGGILYCGIHSRNCQNNSQVNPPTQARPTETLRPSSLEMIDNAPLPVARTDNQ